MIEAMAVNNASGGCKMKVTIPEMLSQSLEVITKPSVATFERYERAGGLQEALIYVAIGAAVSAVLGLGAGVSGFISGIITTVVGFLIFTGMVYFVGKQQGGTGTFDEVAYTYSLFYIPIGIVASILSFVLTITIIGILLVPAVLLAALAAQIYFGYLAVQSSMNIQDSGKAIITLVVAGIGSIILQVLVIGIFS
jgi:Yip1 domain